MAGRLKRWTGALWECIAGPLELQQEIVTAAKAINDLDQSGKQFYHPESDDNARTCTIAANSATAFPIGTCFTFINEINVMTIAITTDTLVDTNGDTGSFELAAHGVATAFKVTDTRWKISGVGLTNV